MKLETLNVKPRCGLVCVGSELLRGKINTHASAIARGLASIGLNLDREMTVGDELPDLKEAIQDMLESCHVVFVTGGLGPTFDDLTREAAAEATVCPLVFSPVLARGIAAKFKRAHYTMPEANQRQAYLLEGALPIANPLGTAPGQWLEWRDKVLILLPGPPREMRPMLDDDVLKTLRKKYPPLPLAEAHLHFSNIPESVVDAKVRPIIAGAEKQKNVQIRFTILAHLGLVDFDIFVSSSSRRRAPAVLRKIVKAVQSQVGPAFYGMNEDYPLEKVILNQFVRQKQTLAVAESCTGGMLAARLTQQPGSSAYFRGGVVSYTNAVKEAALGVPARLLKIYGAVSKPVASAMARGVRQQFGSTWGLSITGIAGPSGATSQKPIGLVYMALASSRQTRSYQFQFRGDRDAVRQRAVVAAMDILRKVPGLKFKV